MSYAYTIAPTAPVIAADAIESMPVTAFFYHPDFGCYVIERGNILELLDF